MRLYYSSTNKNVVLLEILSKEFLDYRDDSQVLVDDEISKIKQKLSRLAHLPDADEIATHTHVVEMYGSCTWSERGKDEKLGKIDNSRMTSIDVTYSIPRTGLEFLNAINVFMDTLYESYGAPIIDEDNQDENDDKDNCKDTEKYSDEEDNNDENCKEMTKDNNNDNVSPKKRGMEKLH